MECDIHIEAVNNRSVRILSSPDIAMELSDRFSFFAPGYQHQPKFKLGMWDGKIKLFNRSTRLLGRGLVQYVTEFAENNGYSVSTSGFEAPGDVSLDTLTAFVNTLGLPTHIGTRDYQLQTLQHCINEKRALIVSPTASGKSKMIYETIRWFGVRALIIVPRKSLVKQMTGDFIDYGYDPDKIHSIFAGQEKNTDIEITISTWQSLTKMSKEWFDQFGMVIGDEAHRHKAKSLTDILSKIDAPLRFAYTGSLDGVEVNKLLIESLFGPYKQFITTSEMIDQGYGAKLKIRAIILKYPEDIRKYVSGNKRQLPYDEEIDYILSHPKRNRFIVNLAKSLKGNTIVLYRKIEKHGDILHALMQKIVTDRPLYYVNGMVDVDEREVIRKIINEHENSITTASLGTFAEGINIPNLHNVIIAHPTKSKTEVNQLIGRGLRKTDIKTEMSLFDIGDDMSWKKKQNYTLRHFLIRIDYYNEERFPYRFYETEV